ncbi:hypothetical protein QA318_004651, partial [Salmonella enterica subsp. enterica serovar Kentucky]|nr:hypothetical protein [Salmonella enterica]ECT2828142.1 hypothetical protein [Salmonella enterica subsp. enterica serovar Kentucky]EEA6247496.1 hypothetical protein [Salmonella enterica subsp. enterica serovar Kentucky]EHN7218000.1 hypothetical protein [Salmonella enterica subsp. enterica serovar Kentucky]EIE2293186.1 hypothetical protein [Salmonella enterica subsp. enterica serovar Kentucky]
MNQIINDILSSSIALGIIAFICKMILKHMDKRGLETYKNKLKIESDLLAKRIDFEFSQKKEREIELGRWGLTLLSSVNGLIGRLKYIKDNGSLTEDPYYEVSTRYYVCQFLCWAQLFRKERNTVVISPVNDEILIGELLKNISIVLRNNNFNFPAIRSLEQQYIGESLIYEGSCMQFKNFNDSKILQDYDVLNGYINALLSG